MDSKVKLAIIDNHVLFREGLKEIISSQRDCEVLFDVCDEESAVQHIKSGVVPDIVLIDVQTMQVHTKEISDWFDNTFTGIKVIVISMSVNEQMAAELIIAGARSCLDQAASVETLIESIKQVSRVGWYLPSWLTPVLLQDVRNRIGFKQPVPIGLSETDKKLLSYLCKEFTHGEIARKMFLSVRTINDYSNKLARKLNVKSKAGLIVYAVKNHLDEYINNI